MIDYKDRIFRYELRQMIWTAFVSGIFFAGGLGAMWYCRESAQEAKTHLHMIWIEKERIRDLSLEIDNKYQRVLEANRMACEACMETKELVKQSRKSCSPVISSDGIYQRDCTERDQ